MKNMEYTFDKETLLQMLANAWHTHVCCGGHSKAERNEQRANEYREALTKMGVEIPSDKKLLETGIFNGEGSY